MIHLEDISQLNKEKEVFKKDRRRVDGCSTKA
jgi:hypothetical protein